MLLLHPGLQVAALLLGSVHLTSPLFACRLLRLSHHMGQHPVSTSCRLGWAVPSLQAWCHPTLLHAMWQAVHAQAECRHACLLSTLSHAQPLLDLVLRHRLPALRMGRPHGQPSEPAQGAWEHAWRLPALDGRHAADQQCCTCPEIPQHEPCAQSCTPQFEGDRNIPAYGGVPVSTAAADGAHAARHC